jgi:hypothetical protein
VQGHALETARDLIARTRTDSIRNWFDCSFQMTDEAGRVVLVMPFSEAVNENGAPRGKEPDVGSVNEADEH